jgi:transposase
MAKKYIVTLTDEERESLTQMIHGGKGAARKLTRARILLKADAAAGQPAWKDEQIVEALDVGIATVERLRRQFVEEGFEAALSGRASTRCYEFKLDGDAEAHLVALACGEAPDGRSRWTLRLLAQKMVALEYIDTVSHETVRRVLKKTRSSPG